MVCHFSFSNTDWWRNHRLTSHHLQVTPQFSLYLWCIVAGYIWLLMDSSGGSFLSGNLSPAWLCCVLCFRFNEVLPEPAVGAKRKHTGKVVSFVISAAAVCFLSHHSLCPTASMLGMQKECSTEALSPVSLVAAATRIIFVASNVLSRQACFCPDRHCKFLELQNNT